MVAVCRAGALPKWVAENKEEPTAGLAVDSTYLGLEKAVGGDDNGWLVLRSLDRLSMAKARQ